MKRLLLALVVGAALAYGAYRYFGIVPEMRAKEAQEGQKLLDNTKERLNESVKQSQQAADKAAKTAAGE